MKRLILIDMKKLLYLITQFIKQKSGISNRCFTCKQTNIPSTIFQKKKEKLWTYTYLNNAKAQIDYILIIRKGINSALNCKTFSSVEGVSSDYRIITAKDKPESFRNRIETVNTARYD